MILLLAMAMVTIQGPAKRLGGSVITPREVEATVTRLMKAAEITGVSIAILNDGKIAYLNSFGVRDKENNRPLTVDSAMSAASFSKAAFAYLVMRLTDQKRFSLDRPVQEYLPKPLAEYPAYSDLSNDPRYRLLTGRMLLSHTSGFPNWRWFEPDRKLKIHFEPGSRYAYSGEGIALLQLVVETAIGKPLEELMREEVFGPLGMTRTSMVWQSRFEDDFANGYDEYGRSLGPQRRAEANAAGSMTTTIRDFARLLQAMATGSGLSRQAKEEMLGAQVRIFSRRQFPSLENEVTDRNNGIRLSYGLGWGLYWTEPYGKAFFKEGHDEGWRHYTVCFDEKKTGIVLMTNSSNGEGIFQALLESLLNNTFTPIEWEGYTPYEKLPPRAPLKEHKEVRVSRAILDAYAGRYGEPPNLILTIRREGDHLTVQENNEPKQEVFAESENQFFSKVADDVLIFGRDSSGKVTRLIVRTGGRDIPLARID